jgi:hypothetical protein
MSDCSQIILRTSTYLEARTNPKGVVVEAGAIFGAEEAVEVLEMKYPDHEQGL